MLTKTLVELQQTFQSHVLAADTAASTVWVHAGGRASPEIQLSIYSYAYSARLKEVLANDYPALLKAVGKDDFNQLAEEYIQGHPSRYFSLREFGGHFSDFLSVLILHAGRYQNKLWLIELAEFEWTLGQAFDAADTPLFSEQEMAAIAADAWPDLRFTMHPSVRRLDLEWNIPAMWKILNADEVSQIKAEHEPASAWLIWREQLVTRFRSLPGDEQQALDSLRAGGSFNEVCEVLAILMNEDEVPLRVATFLKSWIAQGLITAVD